MKKLVLVLALTLVSILGCPGAPSSPRMGASPGKQPTGTGFYHSTAGVQDVASKKVDLTNSADVTVPATANGIITSSGTVLQQASNVLAGSSYVSIGASPATTGNLRLPATSSVTFRNGTNDGNVAMFSTTTNNLLFGEDGSGTGATSATSTTVSASSNIFLGGGSATRVTMTPTSIGSHGAILGQSGYPYAVHGYATITGIGMYNTWTATGNNAAVAALKIAGCEVAEEDQPWYYYAVLPRARSTDDAYWRDIYNYSECTLFVNNGGVSSDLTMGPWARSRVLFANDATPVTW